MEARQDRIAEMESAIASHDRQILVFDQEGFRLGNEHASLMNRLRLLLGGIRNTDEGSLRALFTAAHEDEREWIQAAGAVPAVAPQTSGRPDRALTLEPRRRPGAVS